jgi:hypothetical protein
MRVSWLVVVATSTLMGCIPPPAPPKVKVEVPDAVHTNIEKTTVTVKDAQGNVMRIEEKEMVLQEYLAKSPIELKMANSPPVRIIKLEVESGSGSGAR